MTGSFLRFAFGFLALIGVSFAITVTMDKYASSQEPAQTASAGSAVQNR